MMVTATKESTLVPNREFANMATDEQIERTAKALEANGIHTLIARNGAEAKKLVLEMLPDGAEVHQGASVTLETLGITDEINKSGRYKAVRPKIFSMDRKTHGDEIRALGARPEYMLGSVHAVTEDGRVLIASNTGSQLGAYATGAKKVIWVVSAQKIVKGFEEGMRRIEEYVYPREDAHMLELYGVNSGINKMLIVNREIQRQRITLILVKESLGF